MTVIIADHDIEGYAMMLWDMLDSLGWVELLSLKLTTFRNEGLPVNTSDREVWRYAQANKMILLTNNRNMKGKDSLEQTLREENTLDSFPILTIGNVNRLKESEYRERSATRIAEIIIDLENFLGTSRVFIP